MNQKTSLIHLITYTPGTEAGKEELARQIAYIHADIIEQGLLNINIPSRQKVRLLNRLLESASP